MMETYTKAEVQRLRTTITQFLNELNSGSEVEYKLIQALLKAQKALHEYKELTR